MPRLRFAVIPTRDRPGDYADCLTAISTQVDHVVVVSHGAPYVEASKRVSVITYAEDPPNISRMWNQGLERVNWLSADEPYDVAVLNDDVVVSTDWFATVTTAMRERDAVLGGPPGAFDSRWVAGYAHIIDGSAGLRYDEELQWWYSDTALHLEAAQIRGGVAMVPIAQVVHRHPNSTTVGELARIAGEDQKRFIAKYGEV